MELRGNKKRKSETIPTVIFCHPNGFKIEELVKGKPDGKKAVPGALVCVHYIGKLQKNGKIVVDFTKTPFEFIVGSEEVLWGVELGVGGSSEFLRAYESCVEGMLVGDKRKITLPQHMGYGKHGDDKLVPPNAWLVFYVELLDVRDERSMIETTSSDVTRHEYGLTIEVLVKGKPDGKMADLGLRIRVRYTGKLQKNGEIFDSKFIKKPRSYLLGLQKLGPGFDMGIAGMRVGEKRKITVPPVNGYQQVGNCKLGIPPHAWLVFEVELVGVADQVKKLL